MLLEQKLGLLKYFIYYFLFFNDYLISEFKEIKIKFYIKDDDVQVF